MTKDDSGIILVRTPPGESQMKIYFSLYFIRILYKNGNESNSKKDSIKCSVKKTDDL